MATFSVVQYDEYEWLVVEDDEEEPVGFFDSREDAESMIEYLQDK